MKWFPDEKVMYYGDEKITIRSMADNSVLFTGFIKDLKFRFNFEQDGKKENNSVRCSLNCLGEEKFYPFHIMGSTAAEECSGNYNELCENKSLLMIQKDFSQHAFSFENRNREVLFTAKLSKEWPEDVFFGEYSRKRPPYNLRPAEMKDGIGYAKSIYLNPIKQLIAAGLKTQVQPTCDHRIWYYALERNIASGKLTYLDGRFVYIEKENQPWDGRKLFRPDNIIRDFVKFYGYGLEIWYAVHFADSTNDEEVEVDIIFESDYTENALLRFKGSFIRQSVEMPWDSVGKGYVAYYRIIGIISTVGKEGGDVYEEIDLYSDENSVEALVAGTSSLFRQETFSEGLLDPSHRYSAKKSATVVARPTGLDDLVGLYSVKQAFQEFKAFGEYKQTLSYLVEKANENHVDILMDIYKNQSDEDATIEIIEEAIPLHMAFMGSPGTGKSTVAERVGTLLKDFGLIQNEKPVSVVKSDLVGQHTGDTERITNAKINEALGGILFIDEAYMLFEDNGVNDFGKIALNEIMYAMEHYRDRLVVIFAGYTDELQYLLKHANPGLTSRIPWYFHFDDYSVEEMWEILVTKVQNNGYTFDENNAAEIKDYALYCFGILKEKMDGIIEDGKIKHYFGNGRGVRTFFQYMQIGLAVRIATQNDRSGSLRTFKLEDVDYAYGKFDHQKRVSR